MWLRPGVAPVSTGVRNHSSEGAAHRRARRQRCHYRTLLRVAQAREGLIESEAREGLNQHHSKQMPAKESWEGSTAGAVLRGPKTPHWGCGRCGESANWASRLVCKQCGKAAPQATADKARAEAKKTKDQSVKPPSRRVALSDDARRPRSYASVAAAAKDPQVKAL